MPKCQIILLEVGCDLILYGGPAAMQPLVALGRHRGVLLHARQRLVLGDSELEELGLGEPMASCLEEADVPVERLASREHVLRLGDRRRMLRQEALEEGHQGLSLSSFEPALLCLTLP